MKSAAIIVDVQNDFTTGSLSQSEFTNQLDFISVINNLLKTVLFDLLFYTYDWHPENHISFKENISLRKVEEINGESLENLSEDKKNKMLENIEAFSSVIFDIPPLKKQVLYPRHCVQNTWGAKPDPNLLIIDRGIKIYKGTDPDCDSLSGFYCHQEISQLNMNEILKLNCIRDVYVCGVAYDYCVAATALDALQEGYRTFIINDACKRIGLKSTYKMQKEFLKLGGKIIKSDEVIKTFNNQSNDKLKE